MKLLILSDSHGDCKPMAEIVKRFDGVADHLLFLGDNTRDCEEFRATFSGEIHIVAGNCDFGSGYPDEEILTIADKKILMTHGHNFRVKSGFGSITAAAKAYDVNICLFGHTHVATEFYDSGILFLNPGSISLPRGLIGKSYAVVEIVGGNILSQIIEI